MLWSLLLLLVVLGLGHPGERLIAFFLERVVAGKDVVVHILLLSFLPLLLGGFDCFFFPEAELKLHVVIDVNLVVAD